MGCIFFYIFVRNKHSKNLIPKKMAKFAQYYLRYNLENLFSAEFKDQRQQIFGAFFETNESIVFTSGEGDDRKVYKHQVYHLAQNKNIIVMRIANDKKQTVEQDFKEVEVKHEPSCYVVIDNRENCRRIAIQKNKAFGSSKSVGEIITKCINERMLNECYIGVELHPQFYPMDFYKAWRMQQHHTAPFSARYFSFLLSPFSSLLYSLFAHQLRRLLPPIYPI